MFRKTSQTFLGPGSFLSKIHTLLRSSGGEPVDSIRWIWGSRFVLHRKKDVGCQTVLAYPASSHQSWHTSVRGPGLDLGLQPMALGLQPYPQVRWLHPPAPAIAIFSGGRPGALRVVTCSRTLKNRTTSLCVFASPPAPQAG